MTDKYYDIYFDPADLYVDQEGLLENPDALQIIEFEYDDDTDEVTACRRVDEKGNVLEDPWKNREYAETWGMVHVGDGAIRPSARPSGALKAGWTIIWNGGKAIAVTTTTRRNTSASGSPGMWTNRPTVPSI